MKLVSHLGMTNNITSGQDTDVLKYQVEEWSSTYRFTQVELHKAQEALEAQKAEFEASKEECEEM